MRMKIETFIKRHGVTMTTASVDTRPDMDDWKDADHWRCVLRCGSRQMTVYFSQGRGHDGRAPQLADVLNCLASDSSGIDRSPYFEDWASEYGFDPDSRKAERIYKQAERQARNLERLLGSEDYQFLLYKVEAA